MQNSIYGLLGCTLTPFVYVGVYVYHTVIRAMCFTMLSHFHTEPNDPELVECTWVRIWRLLLRMGNTHGFCPWEIEEGTDRVKKKRGEKSIQCETPISGAFWGSVWWLPGFDPVVTWRKWSQWFLADRKRVVSLSLCCSETWQAIQLVRTFWKSWNIPVPLGRWH